MRLLELVSKVLADYEPNTLTVVSVEPGANLSLGAIVVNIVNMLGSTILYVAAAVFVYGATLYVFSAVHEESKNNGKQYMMSAVIGFFIVFAAKGILNLVMAFIYAPT